jgi:hypothetical protein
MESNTDIIFVESSAVATTAAKRKRKESTTGQASKPKRQKTSVKGKEAQKEEEEEENEEEKACAFFHDMYLARLGAMNSVRVYTQLASFSAALILRIGAEQTEEQRVMESFFHDMMVGPPSLSLADARNRITYVEPYVKLYEKLRVWRFLSLHMRLNMMESLQRIEEHAKSQKGKTWKNLQTQARQIRRDCLKSQVTLGDPLDWEGYEKAKGAARDELMRAGGRFNDELLAMTSTVTDDEPQEIFQEQIKAAPPAPKVKGNAVEPRDEEMEPWTEEEEGKFKERLEDTEVDDPKQQAETSPRIDWQRDEFRFCEKFIKAKNEIDGIWWTEKSPATAALSRAHRIWFSDHTYTYSSKGKSVEAVGLYRSPLAMYKKLNRTDKFKPLFDLKKKAPKKSKNPAPKAKKIKLTNVETEKSTNKAEIEENSADDAENKEDSIGRVVVELNARGYPRSARKKTPEEGENSFETEERWKGTEKGAEKDGAENDGLSDEEEEVDYENGNIEHSGTDTFSSEDGSESSDQDGAEEVGNL